MKKPKRAAAAKAVKGRSKAATRSKGATRSKASSTQARIAGPGAAADKSRSLLRSLRARLAEALRRIDELEAAADTDFLIGIPNRRGFERELHRAIAYMKRYAARGALIVIDVDRLKPINDTFGHAAGDAVLKRIAETLTARVRASDAVGRLGGDEFAVLLWNLGEADARAKAADFEEAIDRLTFVFGGQRVSAGASAGVALLGSHADPGRALEEADAAMYVRKAQRRHERPGDGPAAESRAR